MKKKKKNTKKIKFDLTIKIVLAIVIIILLIHNCVLIRKSGEKIPNGNVEIIEIKCDDSNNCDNNPIYVEPDKDNKTKKSNNKKINNNYNIDNSTEEEELDTDGEFGVVDIEHNKVTWNGSTDLKIFTNSIYELDNVVAPEDANTYRFDVKNGFESNIKYEISFVETNPYNINMKYKLRKNDTYIIDHYVSYDELNIDNQLLNAGYSDKFYLDWKWVSSSNDNDIAKSGANYSLKIEVKAESIND